MKKITLLMALAFIGLTATAQIASENFDDAMAPAGWTLTTIAGDCDWMFTGDTPTGESFTTSAIVFDDDACGSGAPASTVEILSAMYDLSSVTDASMQVDVYFEEAGNQTFLIDVFDGTDWVNVATYDADLGAIVTADVDLAAYTNADFQVRWTYDDGGGAWGWGAGIDNFTLDGTLSTDENTISGFAMFPNPANNEINVSASRNIENVAVFNMLGQKVLEQQVGANSQAINVSRLQTGAYLMQVTADGQTGTYKFVKQ